MSDLMPWPPPPEPRSAEDQAPLLQAHIARMAEAEATLKASLAAAERWVEVLRAENEDLRGRSYFNAMLAAERARNEARAALKEAADALDDLTDWQNGPPLISYTEGWTAAMERAASATARARAVLEGGGRPPTEAPKCPECEGTGVVRDDLTAVVCSRCCGSGLRNG